MRHSMPSIAGIHVILVAAGVFVTGATLSAGSHEVTSSAASVNTVYRQTLANTGLDLNLYTGKMRHVGFGIAAKSATVRSSRVHVLKAQLADVSDEYTDCNVPQHRPTAKMSHVPYWVLVMSRQPNFVAPNQIKSSDLFVDLVDPLTGRLTHEDVGKTYHCGIVWSTY